MNLQDAINELAIAGGIIYREDWEADTGLTMEDVTAEDWALSEEVGEVEEEEEEPT